MRFIFCVNSISFSWKTFCIKVLILKWYITWPRPTYYSLFISDPFADASKGADDDVQDGLVHIRIQQRNGRKTLTTVQGLSSEYDLKKIVRACKKVHSYLNYYDWMYSYLSQTVFCIQNYLYYYYKAVSFDRCKNLSMLGFVFYNFEKITLQLCFICLNLFQYQTLNFVK